MARNSVETVTSCKISTPGNWWNYDILHSARLTK